MSDYTDLIAEARDRRQERYGLGSLNEAETLITRLAQALAKTVAALDVVKAAADPESYEYEAARAALDGETQGWQCPACEGVLGTSHVDTCPARRVRPTEPPMGSCDWGDCDAWATAWRLSSIHGWLPVCFAHGERKPEVERVARSVPEPTHLFEGDATEGYCTRCGALWEEHPSLIGGGADEWRRQTR